MQRNGLLAHLEPLRERLDIQRLSCDQLNDRPPGGIGYCLVYITPCFHIIQVSACEIKHKYSLVQIFFRPFPASPPQSATTPRSTFPAPPVPAAASPSRNDPRHGRPLPPPFVGTQAAHTRQSTLPAQR